MNIDIQFLDIYIYIFSYIANKDARKKSVLDVRMAGSHYNC